MELLAYPVKLSLILTLTNAHNVQMELSLTQLSVNALQVLQMLQILWHWVIQLEMPPMPQTMMFHVLWLHLSGTDQVVLHVHTFLTLALINVHNAQVELL